MQQIYFITGNPAKITYANNIIKDFNIKFVQKKLNIIEGRQTSPKQVVIGKAQQAFQQFKQPLVIEDSGIFIPALNGFPTTLIHFVEETIGLAGILKLMEGQSNRQAEFRSAMAYISPQHPQPVVFEEIDSGFTIATKIRPVSNTTFGQFDRILIPPNQNKTNSELSLEFRLKKQRQRKTQTHWYAFGKWFIQHKP
ncbi:hypothetical protein DRH14_00640 [Candidatus Shapirobacteria bacterium]|nr:MAG: hypothetical protein DRH14_00640 [Candidatus Shapirobacteria bacterium]